MVWCDLVRPACLNGWSSFFGGYGWIWMFGIGFILFGLSWSFWLNLRDLCFLLVRFLWSVLVQFGRFGLVLLENIFKAGVCYGSYHFHLLAFRKISSNQNIVRNCYRNISVWILSRFSTKNVLMASFLVKAKEIRNYIVCEIVKYEQLCNTRPTMNFYWICLDFSSEPRAEYRPQAWV